MNETPSRRVLLAAVGFTQQILTETVHALHRRGGVAALPHEIHVISTSRGGERVCASMSGRLHGEMCKVRPDGVLGSLALDRGDCVCFAMLRGRPAPPEGTRLSCRVVPGFDPGKQRASDKATDLRVEEGS